MPHFNNGDYSGEIEYKAYPQNFWRRNIRIFKWYLLPYFPGQRIDFWLELRQHPQKKQASGKAHLLRYQAENEQPHEQILEVGNDWTKYSIRGIQASGLSTLEYRFGRTREYESSVVVSVQGTDSTGITLLFVGVFFGALAGFVCSALFWTIQYLIPQAIWTNP
jgi:hypothetical protein